MTDEKNLDNVFSDFFYFRFDFFCTQEPSTIFFDKNKKSQIVNAFRGLRLFA